MKENVLIFSEPSVPKILDRPGGELRLQELVRGRSLSALDAVAVLCADGVAASGGGGDDVCADREFAANLHCFCSVQDFCKGRPLQVTFARVRSKETPPPHPGSKGNGEWIGSGEDDVAVDLRAEQGPADGTEGGGIDGDVVVLLAHFPGVPL